MYQVILSTIAVLPFAHGLAFGGPAPTVVAVDADTNGWTPRPTDNPLNKLVRRQTTTVSRDPGLCGWVQDEASTVACSAGRTCALYTSSGGGMAGCCAGNDLQNCGWANSCVPYDAWTKKSCDAECQSNTFIRKCTDSATPYCVTWTYPSDSVADYGCAEYNTNVITVAQSASDLESIYYITLPTYSGLAVTGWDGEASSDTVSESTDPSDPESTAPTSDSNGSNSNNHSSPTPKKKSTPTAVIAGAVVGGLVVLFLIGAAIIFCCVKRRKAKALANNQTIIAAQQAQQAQQAEHKPLMQPPVGVVQSPPPQQNSYYVPQDQKPNYQPQVQVQEQGPQSPVLSNPPTPAPPYVQPYYAAPNAPPLPTTGSYEVDAITTQQTRPQQPNAFEMGPGK